MTTVVWRWMLNRSSGISSGGTILGGGRGVGGCAARARSGVIKSPQNRSAKAVLKQFMTFSRRKPSVVSLMFANSSVPDLPRSRSSRSGGVRTSRVDGHDLPPKLSFSTARRRGGNASSLSHVRESLNPASPGLPLGDSRRFGTVAYVRADASPNESNREFAR